MKRVESVLGWMFIVVVIAVVGGVLYVATRPLVDMTGPIQVQLQH